MAEVLKTFYRYLRPQRFNEKRMELLTLPKGGICLRFEELPEGDLFFTYSRCSPTEFFNKEVAREITDARAEFILREPDLLTAVRNLPSTRDSNLLISLVIERSLNVQIGIDSSVKSYIRQEYAALGKSLKQLLEENARQRLRLSRLADATEFWKAIYKNKATET